MDPRRTDRDALVARSARRMLHRRDGREVGARMIAHRDAPDTGGHSVAYVSFQSEYGWAGQRSPTFGGTFHQPIAVRVSRTPDASEDRLLRRGTGRPRAAPGLVPLRAPLSRARSPARAHERLDALPYARARWRRAVARTAETPPVRRPRARTARRRHCPGRSIQDRSLAPFTD